MKRILALLIIVCLTGFVNIQAQFVKHYGVKAGISIANQSYLFTPISTLLPTDALIGPGVLFFLESFNGEHVTMQMDLGYIPKGNKTTAESLTVNHLDKDRIVVNEGPLVTSRYHYLTFSPMVKYRREREMVIFYTLLGLRVDYLLNYSTDSEYPIEHQSEILLGLTGGFGVEYKLEKLGVFVEVEYMPDINPITNTDPLLINNNCIFVSMGVKL